ncbi:MAG: hypothetical protein GYA55_13920 [SAR324 cluster bacterium]|uniref:Uncharacterized protein n=1 Tax=SAR324 cluster bacterium TaxID=2024889 RepID=A0A7X9FUR1_9DELT|nr:hypothetical protein [SAR324 cluster bacterium]
MLVEIASPDVNEKDSVYSISEEVASVLLQSIMGAKVLAIHNGAPDVFSMRQSSFICGIEGNGSLYLKGASLPPTREMKRRMMDLPQMLIRLHEAKPRDLSSPVTQEDFLCFFQNVERKTWDRLGICTIAASPHCNLRRLARISGGVSGSMLQIMRIKAKILLPLNEEQKKSLSQGNEVQINSQHAGYALQHGNSKVIGFLLSRGESFCFIVCGEKCDMNENDLRLQASLNLGSLEMSLNDFMRLRKGAILKFKKPENFAAVLSLEANDWAKVDVQVEDEEIKLVVKEIAGAF